MKLRTIVVDDSLIFRKAVRDCLAPMSNVEVIDIASDGTVAIAKILAHKPDLVTLDVEMPGVDGLGVLEAIKKANLETNVIMLSSHTGRGASTTTRALSLGAFDFILKPTHETFEANVAELRSQLASRIAVLSPTNPLSRVRPTAPPAPRAVSSPVAPVRTSHQRRSTDRIEAIALGISTGGPKALRMLLPGLPSNLAVPILIVQHMPPLFTASLADDLNRTSEIDVVEAADGMTVRAGCAYIAPGGKQMRLGGCAGNYRVEITDDPAIKSCKPSVDYLFESAADIYGSRLLGIVMTGMGDDGTDGARAIHGRGGSVWAQDEASSTVYGMPRRAVEAGVVDEVLSLGEIGLGIRRCTAKSLAVGV